MTTSFFNRQANVTVTLIPGKFYVVDAFSGPLIGPFDTAKEAMNERDEIQIAGDCDVGECYVGEDRVIRMKHAEEDK